MPDPKRIAILKPSALGDIAHALPVATALRKLYPDAAITWVVNKSFQSLLANHPHITDTIGFDRAAYKRGLASGVGYSVEFAKKLRKRRFDLVLDLQGLLRTGLMSAATGAPVRLGFANAREGSRHFYTRRIDVPDAESIHAVDRYWRMVETLGGDPGPKRFELNVEENEAHAVVEELISYPKPWIAVAPGAKWLTKRWPAEYFADVLSRPRITAVFVGGAEDKELAQSIRRLLPGPSCDFTGQTLLPKLIALLSMCDAMLANDTGPLHVAAALGRPCVAPYICTSPVKHGIYGQPENCVVADAPCANSYKKQCPHDPPCITRLTPDQLCPVFERVIASCDV